MIFHFFRRSPSFLYLIVVNLSLTVVVDMKTIGSKVEDEVYDVFRLVCENDGVTVSDRVRDLVKEFVKEKAPFIVIDQDMSEQLKQVAREKGIEWRELTCAILLEFCEKCSEGKEPTGQIEEKEKTKEMVTFVHPNGREEEVPKDRIRILKESVFKKEEKAPVEEKKPKSMIDILKKALAKEEEKKPPIGEKGS